MMKRLTSILLTLAALGLCAPALYAQTVPTQTTLSAAISDTSARVLSVASATTFAANTTMALIDKELVFVRAVNGTTISVERGARGTAAATHASGAVVTVSSPLAFVNLDPGGSCTATNELYLPRYNYLNGRRWNCINSTWMVDNGYVFLGPEACQSSVSGNSTGTNGYTSLGTAPSIPVVQAQTSNVGTNTHYYMCSLNKITGAITTGITRQVALIDVVAFYGVQTTGLGTQVNVLASGTMNGQTVFTAIAYPAAGASETAKGLAEAARADAGTLVITPVVGSFNVGTTTAGEFFSAKFAPATAVPMQTDLKQYFFTLSLLNTATSATVTNLPGILVHYAYIPD